MKYLFAANATRKRNGIYTWWMVMILLICGNVRLVNGKKLHWQQGSSLQDTCNPRLSTRSKSPILLSTLTLSCRGGQQYYSDDRNNDYYHNEDDYGNYQQDYDDRYNYKRDDDRYGDSKKKRSAVTSLPSSVRNYTNRKVGFSMLAAGGVCMMAGIATFFNAFLLRIAHICICTGASLVVGVGRMTGYFMNPKKMRATFTFGAGLFLVLVGHPILGMTLEIFGFLNLFGNMFPLLKVMLRTVPGVGNLFPNDSKRQRSNNSRSSYSDRYSSDDRDYEYNSNRRSSMEQYY